ncbi:3-oxoacyl-ACP reductase family protein [Brevifollis gellanilyticus]|uniref:3-ketoacyl-ACP reductase n=1 Tax=Brevifollis gellanilyticus TaxID=748831 RepID=A0A512M8A9_9BACT|nr:3-oxoacyl-ACP reductase family protein [Brevifollis gellanilyticus]GEP42968.1 3-ketoacyl-ACP reductase [Brevifollis gellanilyticus]
MKTLNTEKFKGKTALITGGSRGIGAAIAKRLAAEGAAVAFTYASSASKADEVVKAIEAAGGRALAIKSDAAEASEVVQAVAETIKAFGSIDILVNNAAYLAVAPLNEFKLEDFDRSVAINVRGVFVASQEAAKHMTEGGRIITIGSTNAERMPFVGGGVYAMTKAAIVGLTKGLSRDLGPRGITVNNVQPGPIDTDMNPESGPFAESLKALMALPRYGHADEVAAMVSYIAGPEAAFVTGASLMIDGGFSA